MANERVILCGDVNDRGLPIRDDNPVHICLHGPNRIKLHFNDIQDQMLSEIPTQFTDLIEIATYVYCADQIVTRGGAGVDNLGENWRRRLFFRVPVRHPDLWNSKGVLDPLVNTLSFLSDDEYTFEFIGMKEPPVFQEYLKFAKDTPKYVKPEEVVMFSGGLDSLGGAIQEAVIGERKIALVMHKPTPKLSRRHNRLKEGLEKYAANALPIHIPVKISKGKCRGTEYTQRSRSFLYAALGSTIAQMLGLSRVRFYENGIISLNLPIASQVVGARATRTTHPRVLNGFAALFSELAGKPFTVENPFIWKTKTEVIKQIIDAGCEDLIKFSTSCTHTWQMTKMWSHCGACSQCVDRRFAALASGAGEHDPAEAYRIDLLTGEQEESVSQTMLASYVETAKEITGMSDIQFYAHFGEAARVLRHIKGNPAETGKQVFDLYKRHAESVTQVIKEGIATYASEILARELSPASLLRMVSDTSPRTEAPEVVKTVAQEVIAVDGEYMFMKRGKNWVGRFAGGEAQIFPPNKGYAYLNILIANPGKWLTASDLAFLVTKDPAEYLIKDGGDASDREAIETYRFHLEVLQDDLAEAEADDDLARQARIKKEIEQVKQRLSADVDVHGRIRKLADDKNKFRNKVCKAIRKAIEEITEYDPDFGKHLDPKSPRLQLGWKICYHPHDADIEWET